MAAPKSSSFQEKTQVRVRVWMRNHAEDFETATSLGEEAAWLYNLYTEDGSIPEWVWDYAASAKENRL